MNVDLPSTSGFARTVNALFNDCLSSQFLDVATGYLTIAAIQVQQSLRLEKALKPR